MRTRTTRCLTGRLTGLTAALILTSTLSAVAQTPFVPYFGKNRVQYDNFRWHIYKTDHFEIFYYPRDSNRISSGSPPTPKAPISTSAPS